MRRTATLLILALIATPSAFATAFPEVFVGGGYGNVGATIDGDGNISINGDLVVDGTTTFGSLGDITMESITLTDTIRQVDTGPGVTLFDLNIQQGATLNADAKFRVGRDTNTGTGGLQTIFYIGDGGNTATVLVDHKDSIISVGSNDAEDGWINLFGNSTTGSGRARLYSGANYDTYADYWELYPQDGFFSIGNASDTDFVSMNDGTYQDYLELRSNGWIRTGMEQEENTHFFGSAGWSSTGFRAHNIEYTGANNSLDSANWRWQIATTTNGGNLSTAYGFLDAISAGSGDRIWYTLEQADPVDIDDTPSGSFDMIYLYDRSDARHEFKDAMELNTWFYFVGASDDGISKTTENRLNLMSNEDVAIVIDSDSDSTGTARLSVLADGTSGTEIMNIVEDGVINFLEGIEFDFNLGASGDSTTFKTDTGFRFESDSNMNFGLDVDGSAGILNVLFNSTDFTTGVALFRIENSSKTIQTRGTWAWDSQDDYASITAATVATDASPYVANAPGLGTDKAAVLKYTGSGGETISTINGADLYNEVVRLWNAGTGSLTINESGNIKVSGAATSMTLENEGWIELMFGDDDYWYTYDQ